VLGSDSATTHLTRYGNIFLNS